MIGLKAIENILNRKDISTEHKYGSCRTVIILFIAGTKEEREDWVKNQRNMKPQKIDKYF